MHEAHFKRWKHRKARIDDHNRKAELGQVSYVMDDNEFTDLVSDLLPSINENEHIYYFSLNQSDSDLNSQLFGLYEPPQTYREEPMNPDSLEAISKGLPPSVDLRNVCMPPIKYQSPCGNTYYISNFIN